MRSFLKQGRVPASNSDRLALGGQCGLRVLLGPLRASFDNNSLITGILVLNRVALALDAVVGVVARHLMKCTPRAGETEKL